MKTMTCKQLGGPCDVAHRGNDHNEVIKAQARRLKAQVEAGDETHREAHEAMRGRWKRPISGLGGYRDVKREFAGLPHDAEAPPAGVRGAAAASGPRHQQPRAIRRLGTTTRRVLPRPRRRVADQSQAESPPVESILPPRPSEERRPARRGTRRRA